MTVMAMMAITGQLFIITMEAIICSRTGEDICVMERTIKVLLILPVIILCLFFNNAQSEEEDNFPDCPKYIGDLNKRGNVKNAADAFDLLLNQDDNIKDSVVSTSFLKEKGKPGDFYAPWKVNDNDKNTAWVEGVKGDGIGEKIFIKIIGRMYDKFKPLDITFNIINGYAQNDKFFFNNRIKKARVLIREGEFDICGGYYSKRQNNLIINNEKIIEMDDTIEPQIFHLKINEIKSQKKDNIYRSYIFMAELEILEVYKGTKYDDTCISEFNVKDIIEEGKKIK